MTREEAPISERPTPSAGELAAEIRRRLGPGLDAEGWPLVSIVVPNRDGVGLLRRLLVGLVKRTDYPRLELILVDNASSDDSLDFIRSVEAPFPVSILSNPHNESFSDACNQGAELASGDLLLFLNNDIEPFESGWLRELVACRQESEAGAVAATLLCRNEEHDASFPHGYGVQHRGLAFREEAQMIHPVLHGWEADPLDDRLGEDEERGALAAACMLVARDAYERAGGFSHGYVYGAEDVDLCLKLRAAGHRLLCSGRSLAIHHPVSTRRTAPLEEERARKLGNRRVLWERWGPQLRREHDLDRLEGRGLWAEEVGAAARSDGESAAQRRPARDEVEALGFCLKAADPATATGLDAVAVAFRQRGHRSLLLEGEHAEDLVSLNYDVAVHVRGSIRYVPRPAQVNVLWNAGHAAPLTEIERSRYDLVFADAGDCDPAGLAERLIAAVGARIPELGFARRIGERGREQIDRPW